MNSAHRQLEIVNAAFDCIATTGHLSLSTTELAFRVGISQPAIFRHFRSKQQLHQAVLDEANQRIIDELKLLIGHSELWNNPLNLLQDISVKMGASFERAPGVWLTLICQRSIAMEAELDQTDMVLPDNKSAIKQLGFTLERLANAAIENGQLARDADPYELSSAVLSLLFGMGQLWLNANRDFDLSKRLDFATRGLTAGFMVEPLETTLPMSAIA